MCPCIKPWLCMCSTSSLIVHTRMRSPGLFWSALRHVDIDVIARDLRPWVRL